MKSERHKKVLSKEYKNTFFTLGLLDFRQYVVCNFKDASLNQSHHSVCWRARVQGTRCCSALPSLLPMMSVGDNRRKRTGRLSYLFVAHFLSLPLSPVSSGSEPFAQYTGCNTETT